MFQLHKKSIDLNPPMNKSLQCSLHMIPSLLQNTVQLGKL